MTYRHVDNEEAIAYAWMAITILIIIAGVLLAVYYGVINMIIAGPNGDNSIGINHDIAEGKQSQQSRSAMQFNIDFATNIPLLFVMGVLIYAVARSIVVKGGQ